MSGVDNTPLHQSHLREMTAADLEHVLKIRNHNEIRRNMLTHHEIAMNEHISWFHSSSQNENIELLVFEMNEECCGFVQFKKTHYPGVQDWGFFVSPDAPKGTGKKLGMAALSRAFKKDNLHKIRGEVLEGNQSSIGFHKSLGFLQEGVFRDHHFDGEVYHNIICFGLLKHDWVW